jgi:hypothetical protein
MVICALTGHRLHFGAEGDRLVWACARCGGARGEKRYGSAAAAARYARAFERDARVDFASRTPLSLLPLRLIARASRET